MTVVASTLNSTWAVVAVLSATLLAVLLARWRSSPPLPPGPRKRVDASHAYGVAESVGRRPYMEDRHAIARLVGATPTPTALYAVFDGHAGAAAAQYCSTLLETALTSDSSWPSAPGTALTRAFLRLDTRFLEVARAERPPLADGTTALAAVVVGSRAWVANAGDSRAIVVQRNGRGIALSDDHKPNRPDEISRIKALGGSVYFHGVWRVGGVLAVSRAIGDAPLKPFVTAFPEIQQWECGPDDVALVLATDGLWDVMSNDDVARTVIVAMAAAVAEDAASSTATTGKAASSSLSFDAPAQRAASTLIRDAILGGSMDNCTALVVDLTRPILVSSVESHTAEGGERGGVTPLGEVMTTGDERGDGGGSGSGVGGGGVRRRGGSGAATTAVAAAAAAAAIGAGDMAGGWGRASGGVVASPTTSANATSPSFAATVVHHTTTTTPLLFENGGAAAAHGGGVGGGGLLTTGAAAFALAAAAVASSGGGEGEGSRAPHED